MTVTGTVAQVTIREKLVYLNLDKPFPQTPLAVVIFARNTNAFGDLSALKGRQVEITGKIEEYKERPQIVLVSTNQLRVKSWDTRLMHLPPLVLGILALQFLFDAGVMVPPEAREILRDLHRPHVGGQDVHHHRHAAHGNRGVCIHVEEFLDAQGDVRRVAGFIGHFRGLAIGQASAARAHVFPPGPAGPR